jgi:hypothetical protein
MTKVTALRTYSIYLMESSGRHALRFFHPYAATNHKEGMAPPSVVPFPFVFP